MDVDRGRLRTIWFPGSSTERPLGTVQGPWSEGEVVVELGGDS